MTEERSLKENNKMHGPMEPQVEKRSDTMEEIDEAHANQIANKKQSRQKQRTGNKGLEDTPDKSKKPRILVTLNYNEEEGIELSENARLTFFGRK